jgi:hypothetical protein
MKTPTPIIFMQFAVPNTTDRWTVIVAVPDGDITKAEVGPYAPLSLMGLTAEEVLIMARAAWTAEALTYQPPPKNLIN